MLNRILIALTLSVYYVSYLEAQELPPFSKEQSNLVTRFNDRVQRKTEKLEAQLSRQTEKYLHRLARKEEKLRQQLQKTDSTTAQQLFKGSAEQYAKLSEQLTDPVTPTGRARGQYLPYVDSLKTSLSFLQQNSSLLRPGEVRQIANSLQHLQQVQYKLQQTEQIKAFIKQRREQIKAALSRYSNLPYSIIKTCRDFNKDLFYYSQQVQEYRDLLNDPDKLLAKTLSLLNKLPAFQSFLQQYSELAGLFAIPARYGNGQSLAGLQTRHAVQQLMQTRLAVAGPNASQLLQQHLQAAQAQLNQLKDKSNKPGSSSADPDMSGFKPNNQKTRSFWQRLEYGTNLQTQKSNNFFPTTTDIGLSVGYKLSDKSIIGIGGSYKVGWGKDIRLMTVTSEGAGLRSFLDVKLKGSFFASGGFEYNYQPLKVNEAAPPGVPVPPQRIGQGEAWQQSGLVGISKIISLKSKTFRKTKLQLLWDFLSYQQAPGTQAVKFRVGYDFK